MRLLSLTLLLATPANPQIPPTWTTPQPPFRIAGNLYYVGSQDLASYLITTPAGNILLNSNLASSPPQIKRSIEQLGFRYTDIRILLNSQAHFDHAAGTARILRETHAQLEVMDADAPAFATGDKDDFGGADILSFPPAPVTRILHDGSTVTLGHTILTAHKTAGHTPGCTTWTFEIPQGSNQPALKVLIAGGFAPLSSYRLVATPTQSASYPGIAQDFAHTFDFLTHYPCDLCLGAHGSYFGLQAKLAAIAQNPTAALQVWRDSSAYRKSIADAEATVQKKLANL